MIAPICNDCGNELTEFGSLAFSAPNEKMKECLLLNGFEINGDIVVKTHICTNCSKYNFKNGKRDSNLF